MQKKIFLKVSELAELTGISPRVLSREIAAGRLPAAKIGRSYFVSPVDLARFIGESRAADILKVRLT